MTSNFYDRITGFEQFTELSNPLHYAPAPSDWFVVTTDVKNSTIAIEAGKYKEINLSGAAVIISILNVSDDASIPYAFGGDGATMLIPPALIDKALIALTAVQAKVKAAFDLDLRAGCVPIKALYGAGASLLVGKFFLSPTASQAVFQGNALAMAEQWLKQGNAHVVLADAKSSGEPDLEGLECRWQPLQNRQGKIISLLVKVTAQHETKAWQLYADTLKEIEAIYPEYASSNPAKVDGMHLSFANKNLIKEATLRQPNTIKKWFYLIKIYLINAIGHFSFTTKKKALGFDGTRYLQELVANSDSRKFDEMIRMVLDSTQAQHDALEAMLKKRHVQGQIVYGIHESSEALMTCLVFSLVGDHVHLIDGADGGYALAAKQLKQQMTTAETA
jgi:hypothetical protein